MIVKSAELLLPLRLTSNDEPMSDIRCIGIATGGGDAPGLNAVIRAATKAAIIKYGWKVIGIPDGFDGLIWPEKSFELTMKEVTGILPRGGTILGTTNRGDPFHYKTIENGKEVSRDISSQMIANAAKLGIDAIITIGGDGSQKIGSRAFPEGNEDRRRPEDYRQRSLGHPGDVRIRYRASHRHGCNR